MLEAQKHEIMSHNNNGQEGEKDDKTQSSNENNKIGLDGEKALLIKEDDDGKIMGEVKH